MPQALKTPTIQELIADTTPYSIMNMNRTTWRISRTITNGSTLYASDSVTSVVDRCTSPTPPSVCIWNGRIGNI